MAPSCLARSPELVVTAFCLYVSVGDSPFCTHRTYGHFAKWRFFRTNFDLYSWFPYWHGGGPLFEAQAPGYYIIATFCLAPLIWVFPHQEALFFNLFNCLPLLAAPSCLYYATRSLGYTRTISLIAAFVFYAVDVPYSGPFASAVFVTGGHPGSYGFLFLVLSLEERLVRFNTLFNEECMAKSSFSVNPRNPCKLRECPLPFVSLFDCV